MAHPPVRSFNREGLLGPPVDGWWGADAPAKFSYERPPGLHGIEVEYALADTLARTPEKWWTDGLDVAIEFEPTAGRKTLLYRRHLDARYNPGDRGLQKASAELPLNQPGRINVWFSPGAKSDASSDWAAIKSVRGIGAPLGVSFRSQALSALHIETPLGVASLVEQDAKVVMVHAPSTVELPLRPGMFRLGGVLGLLPAAWAGPKGSAGAIFEVWHQPPTGEAKRLFSQRVDPVHNASDRGPLPFVAAIPQPAAGTLRLVTRPAHPEDNAFNYTYWGELVAREFPAVLITPDGPIAQSDVEAKFGFDELDEAGRTVTFLHAPSRLVFPLTRKFTRLRGEFGLTAAAYGGAERTDGARFLVEYEDPAGQRTVLWQRELDPQDVAADRGFIPFSVDLLANHAPGRLILRTDARDGRGYTRAWTFWHRLQLEP
jgi:hypothetical protein